MKKQDKAEKVFVACTDVFAELVNVLVYEGKEILAEETLLPEPTESIYEGKDREAHNQFRDYSMYEMAEGKVHALYNLENQSSVDSRMPLRCAGYDGAAYRSQYKSGGGQGIYPVISMVLNWGEEPWKAATTVMELLDYSVHEAAEEYLNQNRIHVFDMRFLERKVRERFEGDVRIVLDYLSDRESLIQRKQKLKNPEEVMRMLYALSGDIRYLENITFMEEGEGKSMCDLLDEAENRGIQKGI
ncbi:MAG: Rpn family recombination-promoting nuclease/putative transposase, partial [Acetatifactor sp.]